MDRWFGGDPTDISFLFLSPAHLAAIAAIAALIGLLYVGRHYLRSHPRVSTFVRIGLAVDLLLAEVTLQIWYVSADQWIWANSLPLQLCSLTLLMSVIMLLSRSYVIYELTFFAGIGGALQAIITPALDFSFPHYRYFHFFAAHFAIIAACCYMTWAVGYRPTFRSVLKTMVMLQLFIPFVAVVNVLSGGNYMFLSRKPPTASLLDLIGPWPWYLLVLEGIAFVLFMLLYVPFIIFKGDHTKEAG